MTAPVRLSGESRVAAATRDPAPKRRNKVSQGSRRAEQNFEQIINELAVYDTFGPGFVGAYNDNVADDVKALTPIVEYHSEESPKWMPIEVKGQNRSGDWSEEVLAAAQRVLLRWRSAGETGPELVWAHARLLCGRGAAWIYDDPHDMYGFRVVSPSAATVSKGGLWIWDSPHGQVQVQTPSPLLFKSYTYHPDHPTMPYTEWIRAVVHIREFISAKGRQRSDADTSKIPDLIWLGIQKLVEANQRIPRSPAGTYDVDEYDEDDEVSDLIRDMSEIISSDQTRLYHQRGDHLPPMPMEGETEPKLISLLRQIDQGSFDLEDRSIMNAARSLRVPTKFMVEGPGNAKYDNEALLFLSWLNQAVRPRAEVVYADWSKQWFWPQVIVELKAAGMKRLPMGFQCRLWFNTDELMPRQDNFENLATAVKLGGAPAWMLADKLKIPRLELPEGMTDFELYETYIKSTNAQNAHRGSDTKTAAAGTVIDVDAAPAELTMSAEDMANAALVRRIFTTVEVCLASMLNNAQRECERRLTRALNVNGAPVRERIKALPSVYAKWSALSAEELAAHDLAPEMLVPGSASVAAGDTAELLSSQCAAFTDIDVEAAVQAAQFAVEAAVYRGMTSGASAVKLSDDVTHVVMCSLTGKV